MRIVFVAMANSIHVARWIRQLEGLGWDLHLFPSACDVVHPEMPAVTYHGPLGSPATRTRPTVRGRLAGLLPKTVWRKLRRWHPNWFLESKRLARTISALRPDLIHTIEIQHAGYLALDAHRHLLTQFPPWLVTNWGSDTYFFARMHEHRRKIEQVLASCDYYDCECRRDQLAARALRFRGTMFPVTPNAGGFDVQRLQSLRVPGPTSQRRVVLLKGYQNWAGRALVGLRAIELSADALRGYRVRIYKATSDVQMVAHVVADSTGIPIDIITDCSHDDMMREHGRARLSIGVSASDALSTSFLEALVMGSFPIQSNTACADEWIVDGQTGMLTDPHDPQDIANAIRRAATDDRLVDNAAQINDRVCRERLDYETVRQQAIHMYETIHDRERSRGVAPLPQAA